MSIKAVDDLFPLKIGDNISYEAIDDLGDPGIRELHERLGLEGKTLITEDADYAMVGWGEYNCGKNIDPCLHGPFRFQDQQPYCEIGMCYECDSERGSKE